MKKRVKMICDGGGFTCKAVFPTLMVGKGFVYLYWWHFRLGAHLRSVK